MGSRDREEQFFFFFPLCPCGAPGLVAYCSSRPARAHRPYPTSPSVRAGRASGFPDVPRVSVRPGAMDVVLQAQGEALVSGTLRTPDGKPVSAGDIDVEPVAGREDEREESREELREERAWGGEFRASIDADGRFEVHGLSAGRWTLLFQGPPGDEAPLAGHAVVTAPCGDVRMVCLPSARLHLVPLDGGHRGDRRLVDAQWFQPLSTGAASGWWRDPRSAALPVFREDGWQRRSGNPQPSMLGRRPGGPPRGPLPWRGTTVGAPWSRGSSRRPAWDRSSPSRAARSRAGSGTTISFPSRRSACRDLEVVATRGHLEVVGTVEPTGLFALRGLPVDTYEVRLRGPHVFRENPRTYARDVPVGTTDLVLHAR